MWLIGLRLLSKHLSDYMGVAMCEGVGRWGSRRLHGTPVHGIGLDSILRLATY
jgi:hypothetical protein